MKVFLHIPVFILILGLLPAIMEEKVKDIDDNEYTVIKIGKQFWMADNLKTTRFRDGRVIPLISDIAEWIKLNTPGYCYYNNDVNLKNTFGALYNWYAAGNPDLCPLGWHVPSDEEWTALIDFLGGKYVAGGKLKEAGTLCGESQSTISANKTGFAALPGGGREFDGTFGNKGEKCAFWSGTEAGTSFARFLFTDANNDEVHRLSWYKEAGFSVRCIKD